MPARTPSWPRARTVLAASAVPPYVAAHVKETEGDGCWSDCTRSRIRQSLGGLASLAESGHCGKRHNLQFAHGLLITLPTSVPLKVGRERSLGQYSGFTCSDSLSAAIRLIDFNMPEYMY